MYLNIASEAQGIDVVSADGPRSVARHFPEVLPILAIPASQTASGGVLREFWKPNSREIGVNYIGFVPMRLELASPRLSASRIMIRDTAILIVCSNRIGILQTPHRFRTKRQLWTCSGFGVETHSSADYRYVEGQLQRAHKQVSIRGLNANHNHDLKNLFKGAAIIAANKPGPFQEFYAALLVKRIRPEMARLTLARKIAAITLHVWKKGVRFDAQYLKPQTA